MDFPLVVPGLPYETIWIPYGLLGCSYVVFPMYSYGLPRVSRMDALWYSYVSRTVFPMDARCIPWTPPWVFPMKPYGCPMKPYGFLGYSIWVFYGYSYGIHGYPYGIHMGILYGLPMYPIWVSYGLHGYLIWTPCECIRDFRCPPYEYIITQNESKSNPGKSTQVCPVLLCNFWSFYPDGTSSNNRNF